MRQPAIHKNYLAAIHIAHKALGLSKDDACALKQAVTGVASAGDMTEQQRKRYLAHLSGLQAMMGHNTQRGTLRGPRPATHQSPQDDSDVRWRKARALWADLATSGKVRTNTDAALMAYVQRQTHVEHWRFLNTHQINGVIESLKRWAART
jgi:hypothetical protein